MPAIKAVHFNPEKGNGKATCGRYLRKVEWRTDWADTTCNRCIQLKESKANASSDNQTFAP